jgi:hypothetical protein
VMTGDTPARVMLVLLVKVALRAVTVTNMLDAGGVPAGPGAGADTEALDGATAAFTAPLTAATPEETAAVAPATAAFGASLSVKAGAALGACPVSPALPHFSSCSCTAAHLLP